VKNTLYFIVNEEKIVNKLKDSFKKYGEDIDKYINKHIDEYIDKYIECTCSRNRAGAFFIA